jgi:hypothetical protein
MKPITIISIPILLLFAVCTSQTQWEKFEMQTVQGYYATSSELDAVDPFEGLGKYGGFNLFDRNPATAWVEGVDGDGIGQTFMIGVGKELKANIFILNGYQKSDDLFSQNNRIKALRLTLYVGFMIPGDVTEIYAMFHAVIFAKPVEIMLEDDFGTQQIPLPFDITAAEAFKEKQMTVFLNDFKTRMDEMQQSSEGFAKEPEIQYFLKFEILDVYKGTKYDDTCISDIWLSSDEDEKLPGIAADEIITDIYKDDNDGMVYVNTDKRDRIILADENALEKEENLVEGQHLYLEIMDVSPDKEWVQISYMYRHEGEGRIESIAHLYSVRFLCHVDKSLLRDSFGLYGFQQKEGKICVDTDYGLVDLEEVAGELEKGQHPG